MSDKVNVALGNLEKARVAVLESAIAERQYRLAVLFDEQGRVQTAVNRARKLIAGRSKTEKK